MKKILLMTVALVSASSMAFAATSIVKTKHDLSSTSTATIKGTSTQICIFCHTPHNANTAIPLWNRTAPTAGSFTLYKGSATLSDAASTAAFQANSVSLLCLSCHDGTTALGAYTNKAGLAVDNLGTLASLGSSANLGTSLANDHPVGFSYTAAVTQDSELRTIDAAKGLLGNAFFGTGGDLIECASCHKVHDNTNAPFLRITNDQSALCLACHIK